MSLGTMRVASKTKNSGSVPRKVNMTIKRILQSIQSKTLKDPRLVPMSGVYMISSQGTFWPLLVKMPSLLKLTSKLAWVENIFTQRECRSRNWIGWRCFTGTSSKRMKYLVSKRVKFLNLNSSKWMKEWPRHQNTWLNQTLSPKWIIQGSAQMQLFMST